MTVLSQRYVINMAVTHNITIRESRPYSASDEKDSEATNVEFRLY